MKTVDAFGQMRIDSGDPVRARLIEVHRQLIAAFPESDPDTPTHLQGTAPYMLKGRKLSMELVGGGLLEFQRASCGCQTPNSLRAPRSRMLARLEPEPTDA